MKIALAFSPLRDAQPADIIDWSRRAEAKGFEAVMVPGHFYVRAREAHGPRNMELLRRGESMPDAIGRRAGQELGLRLADIESMLPDFRYRAVDANGLVENEVCPVFGASAIGPVRPDPAEVMDWQWAEPRAVREAVRATPFAFSPWLVRQVAESGIYAD